MKKIIFYLSLILICYMQTLKAQCDSSNLSSFTANPVDNSGATTNFIVMFNNEYCNLSNLIINDNYTISNPDTTLFITLRDINDNSVIASGITPLTFTATSTDLEVHLFISAACPTSDPAGTFYPLEATNESTLGIDTFNAEDLSIYPNPTSNLLEISSRFEFSKIEIFSINGKLVNTISDYRIIDQIDLSNLKEGTYILKLYSQNSTQIKRIIKI